MESLLFPFLVASLVQIPQEPQPGPVIRIPARLVQISVVVYAKKGTKAPIALTLTVPLVPSATRARLVARDTTTGLVGSVDIPLN